MDENTKNYSTILERGAISKFFKFQCRKYCQEGKRLARTRKRPCFWPLGWCNLIIQRLRDIKLRSYPKFDPRISKIRVEEGTLFHFFLNQRLPTRQQMNSGFFSASANQLVISPGSPHTIKRSTSLIYLSSPLFYTTHLYLSIHTLTADDRVQPPSNYHQRLPGPVWVVLIFARHRGQRWERRRGRGIDMYCSLTGFRQPLSSSLLGGERSYSRNWQRGRKKRIQDGQECLPIDNRARGGGNPPVLNIITKPVDVI